MSKGKYTISIKDVHGRVVKQITFTEEEWFACDKKQLAERLKQEIKKLPTQKIVRH